MRVEAGEIEFARDEKQDRSHGFEASVSACLAFGGLKQSVDGFDGFCCSKAVRYDVRNNMTG
jgi:hypothetical protein